MGFQCGIVGLPNVGKSTLFNALTNSAAEAANYPFCTIEPNVGLVSVPDDRLMAIANLVKPKEVVPAVMRFVDIAGLVAGAAKGEGLGNQFLGHIREVTAIVHVVRCYEDKSVTHVAGKLDPASDVATINTELALSDLDRVEKAIAKLEKKCKTGDKHAQALKPILQRAHDHLANGEPIRSLSLTADEQEQLSVYQFLTAKPILYVANVSEADITEGQQNSNPHVETVKGIADAEKAGYVVLCAALEAEMAVLEPAEKETFLHDFGLEKPGLEQFIQSGYRLLGLHTFFTAGPKEVHAWTFPMHLPAPKAAGIIHSDFEKTFIRAEVINYDDYVACVGEAGAKAAGLWHLEGKDYIVQDGDVIYFRVGG